MRLLTAISIASLVVSIAAVVFVLGLYAELEKSEPETPKEHTQELNETMVRSLIRNHAKEFIKSAGITEENKNDERMTEVWEALPGYRCLWERNWGEKEMTLYPNVYSPGPSSISYNYIKTDDIWLATSIFFGCEELTTWTIDDNTGGITYGHPDEK